MAAAELLKTVLFNNANLKAYYRFESGALTTDSSGNSHTLTAISDPAEGTGVYGGGVDFDADDGYSLPDNTADFKPTGAFSVGGWIKRASGTGNYTVMACTSIDPNVAGWGFGINYAATGAHKISLLSGKNDGVTINTNYAVATGATTVDDGAWHHVVGTSDGTTLRVYVDGKHDGSQAWAANPSYSATSYVRVACEKYNASAEGKFLGGSLDDLFIVNGTALSADQIKELYEGRFIGEAYPQAGLVGGWHLNGNSTDFSGNNLVTAVEANITYSQANGKFGQGAGFNGSSSRLNIYPTSFYATNNTAWTYSAWFKTSSTTASNQIIITDYQSAGFDDTFSCILHKTADHKLTGGIRYSNTDYSLTSAGTINDNKWHHVVLSASKTTGYLNVYLDGNPIGTQVSINTGVNYFTSGADFLVGTQIVGGAYTGWWNGAIDEILIFNRALTSQEIRRMYAVGTGRLT